MSDRPIYTRAYSAKSPRRLVSGRGLKVGSRARRPLQTHELINEFSRHGDKSNKVPTALVSVSTRIVDTVCRAFSMMYYEPGPDGMPQAPEDIWIVFIKGPNPKDRESRVKVHDAQALATASGYPDPALFEHERVFEWEVPGRWVMHRVSLRTLLDRGLGSYILQDREQLQQLWNKGLGVRWYDLQRGEPLPPRSTRGLKYCIRRDIQSNVLGYPLDAGMYLGFFAEKFGWRAPYTWIAEQLLRDCMPPNSQQTYRDIDNGIEQVFIWWIEDIADLKWFFDYEEAMEDVMNDDWAVLWLDWHGPGIYSDSRDEFGSVLTEGNPEYQEEVEKISAQHQKIVEELEEEAVALGL